MKAFTIIRVSSADQLKGYGADTQWADDIVPSTPLLGLEVSETYRRIIQESATGWERTLFEAVVRESLALFDKGEIQALLFPRVDRETRFLFGSFPLLAEVIRHGLKVYFARERLHLDPDNPESVQSYLYKAAQAQAYTDTLRINTMRGKVARAKAGRLPSGTGHKLYGYNYVRGKGLGEGVRYINEEESMWVKEMYRWLTEENMPINSITRRLRSLGIQTPANGKFWLRQTIYRMLTNPAYIGKTYAFTRKYVEPKRRRKQESKRTKTGVVIKPQSEWLEIPNATPAIISQEVFDKAQAILRRNRELSTRHAKHEYLLSGFIFCKRCGRRYIGSTNHGVRFYRCGNSQSIASPVKCLNSQIHAPTIESSVWTEVGALLEHPAVVLTELRTQQAESLKLDTWRKDLTLIKERLAHAGIEKDRAYSAYLAMGDMDKFKENMKAVQDKVATLEAEKKAITEKIQTTSDVKIDMEAVESAITRIKSNIKGVDFATKRLILETLQVRVTIDGDDHRLSGNIFVKPEIASIIENPSLRLPFHNNQDYFPFIIALPR